MRLGASIFFASDSIQPADLGPGLEARGFESLWLPEHSPHPGSTAARSRGPPAPGAVRDPLRGLHRAGRRRLHHPADTARQSGHPDRYPGPALDGQGHRHDRPPLGRPVPVRGRVWPAQVGVRKPRHPVRSATSDSAEEAAHGQVALDHGDLRIRRRPRASCTQSPGTKTSPEAAPSDPHRGCSRSQNQGRPSRTGRRMDTAGALSGDLRGDRGGPSRRGRKGQAAAGDHGLPRPHRGSPDRGARSSRLRPRRRVPPNRSWTVVVEYLDQIAEAWIRR